MRTKIIILAAVSAVMFLGCSKTEKNSEETYKEENIRLKATVRAYEMKFRQNGFDNDMFMREAERNESGNFYSRRYKSGKGFT